MARTACWMESRFTTSLRVIGGAEEDESLYTMTDAPTFGWMRKPASVRMNLVLVEGLRFHRALRVDAAHNTVHILLRRLPILLLALLGRIPHHAI